MITRDVSFLAEIVPPNLMALGKQLATHFEVPDYNIGFKGDAEHKRGYHRSRRFVKNSPYSTNHTYSVSEVPGNRTGGNDDWVCAMDVSLPPDKLLPMCQRLDVAVRAGKIEKVAEWFGNRDGNNRVDGYDNIHNAVSSSDSSHLWHAHFSFIRARANDDHKDLFEILTGTGIVDMATPDEIASATWEKDLRSESLDQGKPHKAHESVTNSIQTGRDLDALAKLLATWMPLVDAALRRLEKANAVPIDTTKVANEIQDKLAAGITRR